MSIYGRSELRRRLKDAGNKGVTNSQLIDLVESLWRDPYSMRTSGFNIAGGTDSQISFTNATRTFSIAPVDKKFSFYQFLHKLAFFKKRDQETVQILDVEGWHMIYYYFDDEDLSKPQKLYAVVNPEEDQVKEAYLNRVLVAWIYWDFVNKKALYFGDERHGSEWNPQIHWWAHESFNAIRKSGLRITDITIGDGSENAHALFGISAGSFYHEDILVETPSLAPGQNFPLYYFLNGKPRLISNTNYAVNKAGSFIDFNVNASGLANMTDGFFQLVHVFSANCGINSLFAYMGVGQYPDPRSAGENLISELDTITSLMAQQTRYYLGTVLFHASSEYTNEVRARVFGELTPELLTDIISKDNNPFLKTGWSPDVMKQIFWFQNDSERRISISPISSAPYYIEGDKYFLDTTFAAQFADETGLKYISRGHNAWNLNEAPFTGYENHFVMAIAAYYNSRKQYFVYAGWRMHLWSMEADTRGNIIKKTGLELVSGLEISFVEDEGHDHKINVSDGTIRLADIVANIADGSGLIPFLMRLRYLEARKHYLITYVDDTDPENPIVTHEWEFDFDIPANVALLGGSNEVCINAYNEADGWHLEETEVGDYTAMWLIYCLDYRHPLKWITGQFASADLDEAKELNNPESLQQILSAAPFFDYKGMLSRVIVKNIPDEPYYELIEKRDYEDGEFEKDLNDRHVVDVEFNETTRELTLFRNAGLPPLKTEIPGGEQKQADWTQNDSGAVDFIKNKPSIPDSQVQADWNQTNTFAPDFIKNKPEIPDPSQSFVEVEQPDHGFLVGQAIRHDGITYILALADNDVNAQVCGIISEIIDTHNFRYTTDGFISGNWIAGDEYFLSPVTPGLLITLPEPEVWAIGQVRISLGWGTTKGLKVEIDAGDVIDELPTVKLSGVWDREAEFCINQGLLETFTLDFHAVYPYDILQLIAGVDDGSLPGSSIEINGVPVGGLNNFTVASKAIIDATTNNAVVEGNEVVFKTSGNFTGDPAVVKVKLKIMRE